MGATQKKVRQGKRNRRIVPQPRIPEVPDNHFNIISVVCWECGESFHVNSIKGGYLERCCPCCGGVLNEEGYDAAALTASKVLQAASSRSSVLSELQERLEKWIAEHPQWWLYLHRHFKQRKLQKTKSMLRQAKSEEHVARKKLNSLQYARYHTGEWYLNTHIPLVVKEGPKDFRYRLGAVYRENGEFSLEYRGGVRGRGIISEFTVFEAFRKETVLPDSALYRAILVPNIYLPIVGDAKGLSALWSQIDLVVLTTSCAFVIEAKSRHADIVVDCSSRTILSNKPGKGTAAERNRYYSFDAPLSQNEGHAWRFQEVFNGYSPDRVYKAVVFTNVRSFSCDKPSFVENTFVGCVPHSEKDLINAFSEAYRQHDPIFEQERLGEIGKDLVLRYGDLDQKRHWLHVNRIQKLS